MTDPTPERRKSKPGDEHPGSRRETKELSRSVLLWIVIVGNVVLLGIFGLVVSALLQPPTDATVEEKFTSHREAFDSIRLLVRVRDGMSGEKEVIDLETQLEAVEALDSFAEGEDVHVVLYRAGSGSLTTHKGLLYTDSVPHPVVENTDAAREVSAGPGRAHKHLADGWYVEYVWGE